MAWVAVDKGGFEFIYEFKPERKALNFQNFEKNFDGDFVELPKGTIEKIIGRKLTWDDDPVEI